VKILLAYNYHPWVSAVYFERALAREHIVVFCGTSDRPEKPGFPPDLDLVSFIEQMKGYPDLVMFISSWGRFFPRGWERLDCPTAAYLMDVHTATVDHLELASFFDCIFIAQRDYLSAFRRVNPNCHWLPLACDPQVHRRLDVEKTYDVAFVGNLRDAFPERIRMLDRLAEHFTMNDYRHPCPPDRMAEVYSRARIVFNKPVRKDLNMRVFEALACGGMLVTERIANGQDELFQEGEHLVAYGPLDDPIDLIRHHLAHDDARQRIAEQGHRLVLGRDTYLHRARQMIETITTSSPCHATPARRWNQARLARRYARIYSRRSMVDSTCDLLWRHQNASLWAKTTVLLYALKASVTRLQLV
jgi:hypothetical protein